MYYPIGWPRKLSCNVDLDSSVSSPEPESVDGVSESLGALKVNGDAIKPSEKVTGSNGHIPQSPETGQVLSNGSGEERRILQVIANGDRSLLLLLTYNSLRLWFPKVRFHLSPVDDEYTFHLFTASGGNRHSFQE